MAQVVLENSNGETLASNCIFWFIPDHGWQAYSALAPGLGHRLSSPTAYKGGGREPKPRRVAPKDLFYAQVVTARDKAGHGVAVNTRVGGPRRFLKQLRLRQLGTKIQIAFRERGEGTLRGLVAPGVAALAVCPGAASACLLALRSHDRQGIGDAQRKVELWGFAKGLQFVCPGL